MTKYIFELFIFKLISERIYDEYYKRELEKIADKMAKELIEEEEKEKRMKETKQHKKKNKKKKKKKVKNESKESDNNIHLDDGFIQALDVTSVENIIDMLKQIKDAEKNNEPLSKIFDNEDDARIAAALFKDTEIEPFEELKEEKITNKEKKKKKKSAKKTDENIKKEIEEINQELSEIDKSEVDKNVIDDKNDKTEVKKLEINKSDIKPEINNKLQSDIVKTDVKEEIVKSEQSNTPNQTKQINMSPISSPLSTNYKPIDLHSIFLNSNNDIKDNGNVIDNTIIPQQEPQQLQQLQQSQLLQPQQSQSRLPPPPKQQQPKLQSRLPLPPPEQQLQPHLPPSPHQLQQQSMINASPYYPNLSPNYNEIDINQYNPYYYNINAYQEQNQYNNDLYMYVNPIPQRHYPLYERVNPYHNISEIELPYCDNCKLCGSNYLFFPCKHLICINCKESSENIYQCALCGIDGRYFHISNE